ncbi:MAG: DNA replication/repair protein RecF [Gemmatimonadaceae bacterium]
MDAGSVATHAISTRDVTLTALVTRHFRNLAHVDMQLPDQGVAIVGDNGHGKTNLLEAIAYFAVMRSVRGVRDRDLVRFGERTFSLSADANSAGGAGATTAVGSGPVRVTIGFESGTGTARKQVSVDGVRVHRLSDAFGAIPSVMIAPRDVALVAGAPGERRRYLDVLLAMTDRRYLAALQRYRAALVRRNASLRHVGARGAGDARHGEVAVWEAALAEAGAIIRAARLVWLRRYADRIVTLCIAMGERERVALRYAARPESTEARDHNQADEERRLRLELEQALEHDRPRDIRRQLTHAGPHRDDLSISLGGHSLRLVGSAGQQRTVALALRLAARETLRDARGLLPIMLLDDPFAELDASRTRRILDLLRDTSSGGRGMGQLIIAIPRADELPAALASLKRLTIRDGALSG